MSVILIVSGLLLMLGGLGGCTMAKTSIHEISSTLTATMGVLLFCAGVIYSRLGELLDAIRQLGPQHNRPANSPPPAAAPRAEPPGASAQRRGDFTRTEAYLLGASIITGLIILAFFFR